MKSKVVKNASWIIFGRIIQSLLGLIISMITVRYLGPSNFGLISYAASIVAFVLPIMQLGFNNVLVQEFVEHRDNEGEILGSTLFLSLICSFICVFSVIGFSIVSNPGEVETTIVCGLYSIILIFQVFELCNYWFQSHFLSKYPTIVSLIAYVIVSLYKIYLLVTGKSIYWFAVSNALDYLIIAVLYIFLFNKMGGSNLCFSMETAKRILSKSRYYIVANLMVTIFAQTDKIMLKQMIDNSATGFYSAAVTCTGLSGFVFSAIIDSMRPSIFEAKKISEKDYKNNIILLYNIIIYLSLLQSIVMTLFAPLTIHILYGMEFFPAVHPLRLVVWYTTFSYMGAVRNIWILGENKQKYLWIINLSGAIMNIVLNALLIPIIGVMGAALASLITQFFANVIIGYIIPDLRENNALMVKSLNPLILYQRFVRLSH